MNVAHQFSEIAIAVAYNRFVKDMPVPAMPQPVKSRRINLANAVWIWIYWQAGRIPEAAAIDVMLIQSRR